MSEKQRTRRLRHELAKAKAELARQDAELADLEAEMDPEALAEAERTLDERLESDSVVASFAKSLERVSRSKQTDPKPFMPAYAVRV